MSEMKKMINLNMFFKKVPVSKSLKNLQVKCGLHPRDTSLLAFH